MPAPPFTLTPLILSQLAEICEQVGQLEGADGVDWGSRSPQLRKDKRIRSIHSSLAIENNSLSLDQVSDQVSVQVKKLLRALCPVGKASTEDLMTVLQLKHRPTFRCNYPHPAMDQNLVTMTQLESPNSPTQKYHLTDKGKAMLKMIEKNKPHP